MAELRVKKVKDFSAELKVPGDKSISHRSLMFGALSNGPCEITGFLASEDCLATMEALSSMGVEIERLGDNGTHIRVHGCRGEFKKPEKPIDCGNSGTTMRLMAGILAGQPFESTLTGDESLSKRPMNRVAVPLERMGARIKGQGDRVMAPLVITGREKLTPIHYDSPVASAQIKSAIMLAALKADGKTTITEPHPSRDHTERMLNYLLVKNIREGDTVSIWGGQTPESRDIVVPGDISSAAFWIVAAAARKGARLLIDNVGLNPTRIGVLSVMIRMGAKIIERIDESGCEPMGSIEVVGDGLRGTEIGGSEIPTLIDEIPILAVAAALAEGKTVIKDAQELRVKESDRISAVAESLRRMGVPVDEFADGMEITGGHKLKGAEINSLGDHRIAMSFAIAGLFAEGETVIKGVECIETSYPGFIRELKQLQAMSR
ncbi:3-phosphoshikimate 1-carboxyvinyltransferase [Verrucomicrobiales bacterium BCK34]|nr:3-phosphoshikimate 1-carboxyvinyltransferase [Verrucomicrobiales bacterium BCK34]